jgi:hypothetical protein
MNFVIGKERSGTTLFQVMLNSHPNIVAPPESRFMVLLYGRYGSIKRWSGKNIDDFCNDLFREGLFTNQWQMDKNKLRLSLLSIKDFLTYPLVCKTVFLQWANSEKQVTILMDKNPIYYFFLPTLEKLFPDAKYIHLVRDYRAYLVSYRRVFSNLQNAYTVKRSTDIVYRWMKVNMLIDESKIRNPGRYFTLKYETLVTAPESSMKEVCSFLGIPFSEKMTKDHTAALYPSFKENKNKRFREMHRSIYEPINLTYRDEWKEKLLPKEITQAESVAGEFGSAKYGYLLASNKPLKWNYFSSLYIKTKYLLIKRIYSMVFSNLTLYYFIRRRVWRNF